MADEPFWSVHTHSKFSVNDALPSVQDIVRRAVELDYPAIALTDHGSPSGNVSLYRAARKAQIEPLPGVELYLTADAELKIQSNMHLTVVAYSETGYRNLNRLATMAARHFYYKPRVDFADLADLAENGYTNGLAVGTGCFSGPLVQALVHHGPAAAAKIALTLAGWFPTVYVELMSHGIETFGEGPLDVTDDEVLEGCWNVAQDVGLPVIISRDSHYIGPEDREKHDTLKRLIGWGDDPDDAMFSGEGYWMTDKEGLKDAFPRHILDAGI
ncbi:MAG TPA: PHP domain-containing protein, partial [Ornithinibacter sp.]|nr:PHP domain-containing protein [Ornithinibacter sp.]